MENDVHKNPSKFAIYRRASPFLAGLHKFPIRIAMTSFHLSRASTFDRRRQCSNCMNEAQINKHNLITLRSAFPPNTHQCPLENVKRSNRPIDQPYVFVLVCVCAWLFAIRFTRPGGLATHFPNATCNINSSEKCFPSDSKKIEA